MIHVVHNRILKENKEILFNETQRFRQIWLWLLISFVFCITGYPIVKSLFDIDKGSNIALIWGFETGSTIPFVVSICIVLLFGFANLKTIIAKDGIYYKFLPFHWRYRKIDWDIIEKCYIRKYNPLMEYGGYGLRIGAGGTAKNVSGNLGLQIIFKNGKKILIGTQKAKELEKVIEKLKDEKGLI